MRLSQCQEVKRHVRIFPGPAVSLAVDHPSLQGMKLQRHCSKRPRIASSTARASCSVRQWTMASSAYRSNRTPGKWPLHPDIERVVQKEIGEQRTDHAPLRRAARPLFQGAIRPLHRRPSPARDVQPDPRNVGVVCHGACHQLMIQTVEKGLDVPINHPGGRPASLPRHPHCVECRLAGSIALGVRMEHGFHQRLRAMVGFAEGTEAQSRRSPPAHRSCQNTLRIFLIHRSGQRLCGVAGERASSSDRRLRASPVR